MDTASRLGVIGMLCRLVLCRIYISIALLTSLASWRDCLFVCLFVFIYLNLEAHLFRLSVFIHSIATWNIYIFPHQIRFLTNEWALASLIYLPTQSTWLTDDLTFFWKLKLKIDSKRYEWMYERERSCSRGCCWVISANIRKYIYFIRKSKTPIQPPPFSLSPHLAYHNIT